MKNGTCPKRNSREVYRGRAGNKGGEVNLAQGIRKLVIGFIFYSCINCGYAEWYANEEQKKDWSTLVVRLKSNST